ncbi:MAG: hypothetical protein ACD_29C00070G0001 [uncultured bacterium]|nr:MAG: hypothetical protein ACD_29C00070G0001 [uncultured bacterium]
MPRLAPCDLMLIIVVQRAYCDERLLALLVMLVFFRRLFLHVVPLVFACLKRQAVFLIHALHLL